MTQKESQGFSLKSEKVLLFISFLIITLVYVPYIVLGQNSLFPIHDNMDSNIIWAKMVADYGGVFTSPNLLLDQMMDGHLHRSGVYGLYDIGLLAFGLVGPFWGYVVCKYLMAVVGFYGMYLLIKRHVLLPGAPIYLAVVVGLLFGLLPFWSFTATVAWSPLAVYALLNLRQKDKNIWNWCLLFLYALFSSLVLIGLFVLLVFAIIWIIDIIKTKKVNWYLFGGLAFLSFSYVLSHLSLFTIYFFDPNFESVRVSFVNGTVSVTQSFWSGLNHIVVDDGNGEFWAFTVSLQRFVIIPITILAGILLLKNKIKNKLYVCLILFIVASSFFASFYLWDRLSFIHEALTHIIPMNLRRIYWLTPLSWYVLFALSLCIIIKYLKKGQLIAIIAMSIQFIIVIAHQEYLPREGRVPYNKFYAEHQFTDIKNFIGKDTKSYRVISLGIHPAISQYNGFYTVDGYSTNFPLSYKYKFRKIIEKELDKNTATKNVYDDWGSWCYAFSGEQGFQEILDNTNRYPTLKILDFNYELLKEMGGEYIISAAKIDVSNNPHLQLLKAFDNYDDSNWEIYLYQIL